MTLRDMRRIIIQILEDESVNLKDEYVESLRNVVLILIDEEEYRRKVRCLMGDVRRNT